MLRLEFAQSLNAGHDTFVGVLVNLDRDKLGLTNADDRRHDQHGLAAKRRQRGRNEMKKDRIDLGAKNIRGGRVL